MHLPLARRVIERARGAVEIISAPGRMRNPPRGDAGLVYAAAKRTLLVTLRPKGPLRSCKPSADYELPLGAGCPGLCQYCYLQSTLGMRPYVRVYADLEEIMAAAAAQIQAAGPGVVPSFETSSLGDPMAVEHLTGALAEIIPFFGRQNARMRLVTKFAHTGNLETLAHAGHTRIRYSLNTPYVTGSFEAGTDPVAARIAAANRLGRAGYPIGFVLAPLMLYPGWREEYAQLLDDLALALDAGLHGGLTFELISHRFTPRAKASIEARFPRSRLDLDESRRRVKWGRYGRPKFVYPASALKELWHEAEEGIRRRFPAAEIEYRT